jgi:tetratricopeptide repeat protein 21B
MKKGVDPVLVFWKAFGIFQEGSVTEAIRELSRIQERREVQFAAAVALIYYHERCRNIDQETIDTLTITLDEKESMASDRDLLSAGTFLWHTQQFKRAGTVVQKLLDNNGKSLTA